jgi:LysR family transcriptional activator of nhaA
MINYRHLYYFWVVAKEGGFSRAAERLGVAIQTVSAQVRELEKSLGHQLLKPSGRGVALTDAGRVALARSETIFQLGQSLPADIQRTATRRVIRLAVGLSDGISKLAAHTLMAPLLGTPNLHLVCHEGEFEQLLAELALHHLDVVLAGQAAPPNPNLRLRSTCVSESPVDWFGPVSLIRSARHLTFPASLATLPVLLPTGHSVLRATLDRWFEDAGIVPNVVAEFEDSALMSVFGARGLGIFPASRLGGLEGATLKGIRLVGSTPAVTEEIHAIRSRRGEQHPLVKQLLNARTVVA